MPQVLNELDSAEIVRELRTRGFGIDNCHGYAFRLTVFQKVSFVREDGKAGSRMEYVSIGGIRPTQYREIRVTSRDVKHAADRVESICRGVTQEVAETGGDGRQDLSAILYAVDNRIDAKLEASLAPVHAALAAIGKALNVAPSAAPEPKVEDVATLDDEPDLVAPVVSTPDVQHDANARAPKKRPGWPKGKKRGPRKAKAEVVVTPS